ncbi:MAG: hypothetical protein ACXAC7_03405 [Candidatus Hodarchaeales archaeon]|jgi:hypothetical protein
MRESVNSFSLLDDRENEKKTRSQTKPKGVNALVTNVIVYRLYLISQFLLGILLILKTLPFIFSDSLTIEFPSTITLILPISDFRAYIALFLGFSWVFLTLKALIKPLIISQTLDALRAYGILFLWNLLSLIFLLFLTDYLNNLWIWFIIWLLGYIFIIKWQEQANLDTFLVNRKRLRKL